MVIKELKENLLYIGIFDGHGSSFAADYVMEYLEHHMTYWLSQTKNLRTVLHKSFIDVNNIKHGYDAFLMLATDGLSFVLSDDEMVNIISSCQTPTEAATLLADQALHFGSEDNCSVIVQAHRESLEAQADTHQSGAREDPEAPGYMRKLGSPPGIPNDPYG
nr:hypothetical protein BaRGS_027673 [Batillaria attramentaria]